MVLPTKLQPQPSERWVMYRMVCPLIDESCKRSGLGPYFEYAQPSRPNAAIKVDVALLRGDQPVWYVEAKKFARDVDPRMVQIYLHDDVMGIVTNGNYWVFVVRGKTMIVGPILDKNGAPRPIEIDRIVAMLACLSPEQAWTLGVFNDSPMGPVKSRATSLIHRQSMGTGTREFAVRTPYTDLAAALGQALRTCPPGSTTAHFLQKLRERQTEATGGRLDASDNRLVWWGGHSERLARINLKSKQLEILVANEIIDWIGEANISARLKIHDKNPKMTQAFAPDIASADTLLSVFAYPLVST